MRVFDDIINSRMSPITGKDVERVYSYAREETARAARCVYKKSVKKK